MGTAATAAGGRVCACGSDGAGKEAGHRAVADKAVLTRVGQGAREGEGRAKTNGGGF